MIAPALHHRLDSLTLGPLQSCENFAVFPLLGDSLPDPSFRLLKEALEEGFVTVEEIGEGGSVPELEVVNDSDHYVLLLDGEEVAGAKQNRVLNTTILLDKRSRTRIPVSCTEAGRWSYTTRRFFHSGKIMSSQIRKKKASSVSKSLKMMKTYQSDQGEVWSSIAAMHHAAGTSSKTGAMKDAYDARERDLSRYTEAIHPLEKQVGMLVVIDGKPAGCDIFSRTESYRVIAPHLTESYAMDALISRRKRSPERVSEKQAEQFLRELSKLKEDSFDSVGVGRDLRYEGPPCDGTALLVGDTPVHAAFFFGGEDREEETGEA